MISLAYLKSGSNIIPINANKNLFEKEILFNIDFFQTLNVSLNIYV